MLTANHLPEQPHRTASLVLQEIPADLAEPLAVHAAQMHARQTRLSAVARHEGEVSSQTGVIEISLFRVRVGLGQLQRSKQSQGCPPDLGTASGSDLRRQPLAQWASDGSCAPAKCDPTQRPSLDPRAVTPDHVSTTCWVPPLHQALARTY
jgi:hypothetical protein